MIIRILVLSAIFILNVSGQKNEKQELVFGYFGASAVTSKARYFNNLYENDVKTLTISSFPEVKSPIASFGEFEWLLY